MTTKQRVFDILKNSGNEYISGQEIADRIFVTRAAVWKAIKSLKKDGYDIDAVTNKGYRIRVEPVGLEKKLIEHYLRTGDGTTDLDPENIFVFDSVGSTNDEAKRYAQFNDKKNAVFIADSQTKGRGRRGREFFSPKGTGIYMSLLLYPDMNAEEASVFTCIMAECICRAIETNLGIKAGIKWVNDIYIGDKKVAGILTEGSTYIEDGSLEYVVIGVGINVYNPIEGFEEDLKQRATALLNKIEESDVRNKLIATIISMFMKAYREKNKKEYIDGYIQRSILIGKYVKILNEKKASDSYAYVEGIDEECHLCIRYDDGRKKKMNCGEVSVVKY